jgi:hypothetical protein
MDLFSTGLDENQNLLPKDGTVFYYGHMMPIQDANFIWKIYWKLFLGKTMRLSFLVNSLLPKKGRLVWRYYF